MNKKERVAAALKELGYKTETDNDGDLILCYELKNIYAIIGNEDEDYIQLVLPQFHEIEEGQDAIVLATCNKTTRELKLVKTFVDNSCKTVSATCEFYYYDDNSLKHGLEHSLHILGLVRTAFRKAMMELSE